MTKTNTKHIALFLYTLPPNKNKAKKFFILIVSLFLCTLSYANDCHQKLVEAKNLFEEHNYTLCINLLKETECQSIEYYNLLLSAYYEIEDYPYIRQYTNELLKLEIDNDTRAIALHYHALALYQQKQLPEALSKIKEAKSKWPNTESTQYAMTCNAMGNILDAMKNKNEALDAYNEALNICKKLPENNDNLRLQLSALNNIAVVYLQNGKKNASSYIKQALQIYQKNPEKTKIEYMSLLNNVGAIYSNLKDYQSAAQYYKSAADIKKEYLGKNNPSYALSLLNIAVAYYNAELYTDATPYIKEYINILRNTLQRNFAVMTEQEREKYWNTQSEILDKLIVTATYAALSDKNADASLLYDVCLLSKCLLLDTSLQIDKIISESNNSKLKELREQLRINQQILSSQDENYNSLSKQTIQKCDSIERIMIQELSILQDHMQQMQITWEDVQKRLSNNDIAVEFLHLGNNEKESEYAVIMLRKEWATPKVVYINGLAQTLAAKQITQLEMHDNAIFGNLVWQSVCKEVKDGDRIWFVPAGELQLMAIEYLTTKQGGRMCDKYEMHRLSSTKQLVYKQEKNEWKNVALLGGMDYNASIDELEYYANEYNFRYNKKSIDINTEKDIWQPLPGSYSEIQQVNELLKENNKTTFIATKDAATTSAMHNLSGQKYDIIHIATHGFYNNKNRNAMNNSGLVMSGANTLKLHPTESLGNGIMTANEISKLYFNNTELVILSACQSGVGEITMEGVFGLQRSFKMAGVNSILATLWEVNDAVTVSMMTNFYQALAKDYNIYKAYQNAIETIRGSDFTIKGETVSGNSIALWGAFVLIDK